MRFLFFSLSLLLLASSLFADTDHVVLKNGDRFSGTLTQSDGKTVTLKTDAAGDLTIKLDAVQEIRTAQPVHVSLKSGQTLVGNVTTSGDTLTVSTAANGAVNAPLDTVTTLRNGDEQAAYEKTLHPPLTRGWVGGTTLGFALTGGNSETENLNIALTGDRKTLNDEINLYLNSVYATNNAPGSNPSTTANAIQAGTRYSRNFSKRLFAFVGADFQTDQLQSLDLRSVLGGGLGYHLIASSSTTLDLYGGANYTHESYGAFTTDGVFTPAVTNQFAALTLGEELTHKLGASTVLSEKGYFFPDLNDTSQYRATFNLGTVTKVSKWLGWQNAFGVIYVTNPPVGKKTTDVLLTTGLNVAFTH